MLQCLLDLWATAVSDANCMLAHRYPVIGEAFKDCTLPGLIQT